MNSDLGMKVSSRKETESASRRNPQQRYTSVQNEPKEHMYTSFKGSYLPNEAETSTEKQSPPKQNWKAKLKGVWVTQQMAADEGREQELQITIRDLLIYLFFLTAVCFMGFGMISTTNYWYTKVMMKIILEPKVEDLKQFEEIVSLEEFWEFVEKGIPDALYWDFWYDSKDPIASLAIQDRNILFENKLLGLPRLRQVKVRNDSCEIHEDFRRMFSACYAAYSESIEDTEDFGLKDGTAWTYSTQEQLDGYVYWGILASYGGGGYYVDLSMKKNETKEKIQTLKENLWITRGTRVIFFDFTVYNANINLFCIVKLVWEIPPTGGVIPSYSFKTVKLIQYVTNYDYFILACQWMFIAFTIINTAEELWEITNAGLHYFKLAWNLLDMTILVTSYVIIGMNIYRHVVITPMLSHLLTISRYANYDYLGLWQSHYNDAIAFLVFFSWVKLFKYVSFNKTMSQLSRTLSRCATDIIGFGFMFFIVFLAFAQLGYLLFGTKVEDFRNFGSSIFTLLRTILGDFDYLAIEKANRVLGPIFFILYIFFVFFVLLNMFLAIINDTYSEVKSEIVAERGIEMNEYIRRGFRNIAHKLGLKKKKKSDQKVQTEMKVTYDEVRKVLKKNNFTDLEIEMFLAKYDINVNKVITEEETKRILRAFDEDNDGFNIYGTTGVIPADFDYLKKRVDEIEMSMKNVQMKADFIIDKLEELTRDSVLRAYEPDTPFSDDGETPPPPASKQT